MKLIFHQIKQTYMLQWGAFTLGFLRSQQKIPWKVLNYSFNVCMKGKTLLKDMISHRFSVIVDLVPFGMLILKSRSLSSRWYKATSCSRARSSSDRLWMGTGCNRTLWPNMVAHVWSPWGGERNRLVMTELTLWKNKGLGQHRPFILINLNTCTYLQLMFSCA